MSQRGLSKVDSGTCNVSSAPCSSCTHSNAGFTGSKLDESSDENCRGVVSSQWSVDEDGLLPSSMANACNSSNNTALEASKLVKSSHDALSENAKSKETIRCSGISDDSKAVAMTSKKYFSRSRMKHKVPASADESSNCIEGKEDGIFSDDQTEKLNSSSPNNKIVNKGSADSSALVSDPIPSGSMKDQGSTIIESSNALLNEVKSQSLQSPLSNHEDETSSERGNFKENVGPEGNKERDESSIEESTPSGQNGKPSKSTSDNKSDMSESESDDSEMVEHDVKVCDICGDAGREHLLAICGGCSDGAEHTYCMRERLDEVPEGDWLCEECKFAEKEEKQKQEVKRKRETEVAINAHTSGKRHADKTEAAPDAKRQAAEGSTGSPKKSILPRTGALSRETSFKGLDKSRGMLHHQTSFSDDTEGARSTGSQLQPSKGALLKSSSFNCSSSKPKVQLIDDVIPPRQKAGKEHISLDTKEGGFRSVGKQMSSRTSDTGSSHSQEGKSSNQLKDCSTEANVSASTTDQKLTSRCNSSVAYANNTKDLKGLQSDGKRGSLVKQISNLSRNRKENPVASGDFSSKKKCSASKQSSSQAEDEVMSTSCTGEGKSSRGNAASQDRLPRSREFKEVGKRQRSSLLSGAKGLPSSQKGGQTAEYSDTSGVSDSDLSTTKNPKEDVNKVNVRAAVDAAMLKKSTFAKNRGAEQSDMALVSNVGSSSDKTLQNHLPSKMDKIYVSREGMQGGRPSFWPVLDPYKETIVTNEKHLVLSGSEMLPPQSVELESFKPVMINQPFVAPPLLGSSAIPDCESIWQGDLEVCKTINQSAMHSGMQAYLSILASPKVAEVANKFPEKFSLREVPRLSTWPTLFQDIGTKEDHIALFFFAKDSESHERNYKPLVDNMIKKDLALKGSLDNVELLIFASNQLPPYCQRWNMFYFLWGVFRGKKEICTNTQKSSPSKQMEKVSSLHESTSNIIDTQNRTDVVSHENPSDRKSSIERSSSTKDEIVPKEDGPRANHTSCEEVTGQNPGDGLVKKVQQTEEQELGGKKGLPLTVMESDIQCRGQDNPLEKDLNCSQSSDKKRSLWELTRPTNTENSPDMNQEMDHDNGIEGSANKKQKTENGSSSLSGIMKKSPKVVFPLDLNAERDDNELDDDDLIPRGNDNNNNNKTGQLSGTVPNLDLALGAEERSEDNNTKGLLPFLPERSNAAGEETSNSMNKEEDGGGNDAAAVAGSLSLSLSFPVEEERKNVNTPFFLFRDLPR
ncbi:unnamed protein product [Cochlearia groenlandica]